MASLNLANNGLSAEGAKHIAEAIKVNVSALRFDWYHFELDLTSGSTAVVYGYSHYNTAKGALTRLDISANNLTRGALKAGKEGWEDDAYETDMTGTQSHPAATNY